MPNLKLTPFVALALFSTSARAFSLAPARTMQVVWTAPSSTKLFVQSNQDEVSSSSFNNPDQDERLAKTFGGYTVKQRLREEVESPFRKVRLIFFASSAGSALTALYFSFLSSVKAYVGGFSDAPPLEEALTSDAINLTAAIICGFLAFRDYQAGQANLERIAKGGALARLNLLPAEKSAAQGNIMTMADYRRTSRVLICAGGKEYIENISKDLKNGGKNLVDAISDVDVLVVPVLLKPDSSSKIGSVVGDTKACWRGAVAPEEGNDNQSLIADKIVLYPLANAAWADYLKSEIETAKGQGFDVLEKGVTITVKKNGKILRRATGLPRWSDFIGAMEVLDGSKFGMPGDSEKYGGP